jgi:hypothetical protein
MTLQCNNADEGCGLPGEKGTIGTECGRSAETIAGTSSLSEGLFTARAEWSFLLYQNRMRVTPSGRALRDEEVGAGFTGIRVAGTKL